MPIEIIDLQSWGSDDPNEDQAGHADRLAWVIDGATDLVDSPLVGEVSDAAWLAERANTTLHELAADPPAALVDLPAMLNGRLAADFAKCARRHPEHAWEHPSAAALVIRDCDVKLEWAALGDCALIAESGTTLITIGIGGADAGDRRTAAEVARLQELHGLGSEAERRQMIWPQLRLGRGESMNRPGGHAALSITTPPPDLIEHGSIEVSPGDYALLASDGLIRLIDIYSRYDARSLLAAARSIGLAALLAELRDIEKNDAHCARYPRVKQSDDATGVLLRCA